MQRELKDILPVLFTGTNEGYTFFCERTGLAPKDVKRVNKLEELHGYQNKVLFYGHGFEWLPKDKQIFEYTATHGIHLIPWPLSPFCLEFMLLVQREYKK